MGASPGHGSQPTLRDAPVYHLAVSERVSSSIVRLLRPHVRPYVWVLVLVVLLGTVSAVAQKSTILLLAPTWQVLFPTESAAETEAPGVEPATGIAAFSDSLADLRERMFGSILGDAGGLDGDARIARLVKIAVIISLIAAFAAVVQYAFVLLSRWVALRLIVSLRLSIARHLMGLSLRYHGRRHFGDLLSRVSADVSMTLTALNHALRDLIQEPLLAIASLAFAFLISPLATLFVVIGLPILIIPITLLMRRVRKGSRKSLTQLGASVQALAQMFQGIRTVKAFRAEEREISQYRRINDRYVRATMRMVRALALSRSWTILYSHVGMGLLLLVVGWLTIRFNAIGNGGNMGAFFILIAGVYSNIKAATKSFTRVGEAFGACDRLQELLDEEPDIVERPGARAIDGLGAGIRFEHVTFEYPEGERAAIKDLSLEIRPGETLALVGPSGAGKSTFLDLLGRFVDPSDGRVIVDGTDLRELTLDSWTRQFAMVTQEPFLFHTTIEENIRYGRDDATPEDVREAARAANIDDFIESLPEGYATNVAEAGTRLSGGQRQRITIARAIVRGAPLLLLDEATSALDSESEAVVQAALERLMKNHTVIVIAHRLSTIRMADRIAVLDAGVLVEVGTHTELLELDGLYARLHAAQFAGTVS